MSFFENHHAPQSKPDVVLIGAGIMSATLGVFIKLLEPSWSIEVYERLETIAAESSDALNNAGTGHSAFCELNYTPEKEDGTIDTKKAVKIAEAFEISKQFWAYLAEEKYITDPTTFIHRVPHLSFVWGDENIGFLKKRFEALQQFALFEEMEYSEDRSTLRKWMPLIMKDREAGQRLAATRMEIGTDVNFGELTRALFAYLESFDNVQIYLDHEIRDIDRNADGTWHLKVKDETHDVKKYIDARFVFIGAGGGALPLLDKSDIPEAKGYGGFPVSGQWLICQNQKVVNLHNSKVYGKAEVGAPPMSVPHLDTRIINGHKALLFGPFAGFSTKFLKQGSVLDLPASLEIDNIIPMISAGLHNIPLTKYLIDQVSQTAEERLASLRKFMPTAQLDDWKLEDAGLRVQIIKKDEDLGGVLEFGTEIVHAADGSIAALLGASPGASTSVSIMLELLEQCFPEKFHSSHWQQKIKTMIPGFGCHLASDSALCQSIRAKTSRSLHLHKPVHKPA